MSKFQKDKLNVTFKDKTGTKEPIMPRKYTLTHSDETAELFLTVGNSYDLDQINYNMRDEVLGSWEKDSEYYLFINIEVDTNDDITNTIRRDKVFRKELPLALSAIVYGDNLFFENNKELYEAPILVKFNSRIKEYDTVEEWGYIKDYNVNETRNENEFPSYKFNPFPILPPVQMPGYKKGVNDEKKKRGIIETALITMLDPYISSEVYTFFGKDAPYCIQKSDIIDARIVRTYGPCSEEYEIVVGIKAGRRPPFYNNLIITFLISERGVKIKSVKSPRE